MKLVFATHNQNKFREVRAMMPSHIELLSLTHIGCNEDIPETATTVEGNAYLKASHIKEHFGYDCFADDTGLEVTALNNEPGVFSARYAGPENNSEANMKKLLLNLEDKTDRQAQFKTAISLIYKGKETVFLGICEGEILQIATGTKGFGYDPIFKPKGFDLSFAEMNQEEKAEISHRGKATRQLISFLSQN